MSDVWTCCQCRAVNLIANAPERCPICSHTRRGCCRAGRPTFSNNYSIPYHSNHTAPSSSGGQSCHYSPTWHASPSAPSSSRTTPRYYTTNYASSPSSATAYPGVMGNYTSARPSMQGWWLCCCCKQSYNPDLVPERCPQSGHQKCDRCVVLR